MEKTFIKESRLGKILGLKIGSYFIVASILLSICVSILLTISKVLLFAFQSLLIPLLTFLDQFSSPTFAYLLLISFFILPPTILISINALILYSVTKKMIQDQIKNVFVSNRRQVLTESTICFFLILLFLLPVAFYFLPSLLFRFPITQLITSLILYTLIFCFYARKQFQLYLEEKTSFIDPTTQIKKSIFVKIVRYTITVILILFTLMVPFMLRDIIATL